MAMKIRLARGGSKKRPFYSIVAADSRMPRDGRFIEKLGTYNPLLPKDREDRVKMDVEKVKAWLEKGAQPTDRVSRMLEAAGVLEAKTRSNPKKALPGKKAQERAAEKAGKTADAAGEQAAPAEAAETAEPSGEQAPESAAPAEEQSSASEEASAEERSDAGEETPTEDETPTGEGEGATEEEEASG